MKVKGRTLLIFRDLYFEVINLKNYKMLSGQSVNYINFLEKCITILACRSFIFVLLFERI